MPLDSRRRLSVRIATVARWLHVYLSMAGLSVLLFFSVTGVTLNHPDWFPSATRTTEATGTLNPLWAKPSTPQVDQLSIVEHLRATHHVRGALASFTIDDLECVITFKGPSSSADAFLDRTTGAYRLTQTSHGLISFFNDLHKGRDTGAVWSLVIDVSALLLVLTSLTGLVLLFYIKRRRISGLVVAVIAAAVVGAVVRLWVP
jgi:uncharacterized protein